MGESDSTSLKEKVFTKRKDNCLDIDIAFGNEGSPLPPMKYVGHIDRCTVFSGEGKREVNALGKSHREGESSEKRLGS